MAEEPERVDHIRDVLRSDFAQHDPEECPALSPRLNNLCLLAVSHTCFAFRPPSGQRENRKTIRSSPSRRRYVNSESPEAMSPRGHGASVKNLVDLQNEAGAVALESGEAERSYVSITSER